MDYGGFNQQKYGGDIDLSDFPLINETPSKIFNLDNSPLEELTGDIDLGK